MSFLCPSYPRKQPTLTLFGKLLTSLVSVGKINDSGNVSIFTKDGVTVHKEEGMLTTCKGAPILIGV